MPPISATEFTQLFQSKRPDEVRCIHAPMPSGCLCKLKKKTSLKDNDFGALSVINRPFNKLNRILH